MFCQTKPQLKYLIRQLPTQNDPFDPEIIGTNVSPFHQECYCIIRDNKNLENFIVLIDINTFYI